tara:strand:+ start:2485 stop:4611 length:2127 start_codon:yes stop_codon:yes gene_type:complete
MALDERQILSIVGQELSNSVGGDESDSINANRQDALASYLGQPNGKETEGKSSVVSTDVADAIEWIMPEIVKAFTQNNEVVTFDATSSNDELQAEMESKFVYDTLMKDNNGFIIIHQFIKDALMQKNGFIKVFYEKDEKAMVESYTGLTDVEVESVLSDQSLELVEISTEATDEGNLSDVKIKRININSKVKVLSIPPEEFRINRGHNSVDVSEARFTAHSPAKVAGDLIADGYSKELVDTIASSDSDDSDYRFYMQGESSEENSNSSSDPSLRPVEVSECYMYMDIDEDGIAEYVKITTGGGDTPNVLLDVEQIDSNPFISATAILMSHKLFGLSIYDRLKQIQDQKTTLWRNILDNMYLQNNQRTIAVENQVNLDDLMVSRPGGIIRVKRLDAIAPYQTPPLPSDAYKMMDYLDQVRASRSGVSPEGPVTDSMIGDRVGSEGVQSMMSQKEELVGLMIRVIAETGIKPLCYKIREEAVKHQDVAKEYKFRGQWVTVNPSKWRSRIHSTVRVGTGSGNRKEQQSGISQLMMIQEKMMANPAQAMVDENKIFTAIDDFAKFSGMSGAGKYFLDPQSPEGQQKRQQVDKSQQESQKSQQEAQMKEIEFKNKIADAETSKAETAQINVKLKSQVDQGKNNLAFMKHQSESEISSLKQRLDEAEAILKSEERDAELEFKYWDSKERYEVQRAQIKASAKAASENNKDSDDE